MLSIVCFPRKLARGNAGIYFSFFKYLFKIPLILDWNDIKLQKLKRNKLRIKEHAL